MRTTTFLPAYSAGAHQPFPLATLYDDTRIVGQVPLHLAKRRCRWLPLWFPFNCDIETTDVESFGLFELVRTRWERDGYSGFVPKFLRA
jgi:hypothetical protein